MMQSPYGDQPLSSMGHPVEIKYYLFNSARAQRIILFFRQLQFYIGCFLLKMTQCVVG